ncbi:unnamed protein product [Penicillium nalgiovense]|nr:unnamed protein product [Penicillium nalgiovense]
MQPSIILDPDDALVIAPEDLHVPIPDEPQNDFLMTDAMEAPSPPGTNLDVSAPEGLYAPIPDLPQYDFLMTDLMEAPSRPSTDLDVSVPTIERESRKRSRDDDGEEEEPSSPLQKKQSEWTNFTTLSDSSSGGDGPEPDADGDIPMDDQTYMPYKIANKSAEPDSSVWSTMRDYLGLTGRGSTPPDQNEEL